MKSFPVLLLLNGGLLTVGYRRGICITLLITSVLTAGYAWAQVKPGVVIEEVTKDSEAEKIRLQPGDLLLRWSRGNDKGEIISPFDLSLIEVEQAPRGNVTLEGFRGTEKRNWILAQDSWGITARPNLSQNILSIYLEGQSLAKAGKLNEAVERWRLAANQAQNSAGNRAQSGDISWLGIWFQFRAAGVMADAKRWKESHAIYQETLQQANGVGVEIIAQLLREWANTYYLQGDRDNAAKYFQQSLLKGREISADTFLGSNNLESLSVLAWERNDMPKAEAYARQTLAMRQKIAPVSHTVASSFHMMSLITNAGSDLAQAAEYEKQSLAIEEKLDPDGLRVAADLNSLANIASNRGDLVQAEEYLQRALAIGEKHPPSVWGLAINLSGLGGVALARGDLQKAEDYYRRALAVRESLAPNSIGVARNLNMLAEVAWKQGDVAQAENYGLRALQIIEEQAPGTFYAAEIFTKQGLLADDRGDLIKSEEYFRKALAIHEKAATDNLGVADDLNNLGKVVREQGNLKQAEEHLRRALAIAQKVAPGGLHVADSFHRLGNVVQDKGDWVQAKEYYSQALAIREKLVPGSLDHAESLAALASVMRHMQQPDAAAQLYDQALSSLENEVAHAGGAEETRSNFRARHSSYYRDYMDLLVAQNKPERGFEVLERSRARSLLETLAEGGIDIRKGVDPKVVEREHLLQAEIAAKSDRRVRLLSDKHTDEQVAEVDNEIHELVSQYNGVEEQIRTASPVYAALLHPQPLTAEQVQQQLLDKDTLLLEYSLGQERSYVFALTPDSLAAYELPKQSEIESLARKVHALLTARSHLRPNETTVQRKAHIAQVDDEYSKVVAKLGEMLLGPVASLLEEKRLLVVADGALQYIPFSILPEPGKHSRVPLMAAHEIVNLPSASVLAVLRRQEVERQQPRKAVVVLADPVFTLHDARVRAQRTVRLEKDRSEAKISEAEMNQVAVPDLSQDLLTRSARDIGFLSLPRLPFTRQEADSIIAVTPTGEGLKAVDFKANRELSMNPDLANYRIVHLATHGLVDSEHPELSGLVLSLVDQRGRRQNGFLGLEDIYNLDLPVDMVVLSACETGLGKEINGEGLIGLTRGFLYAGAKRVVASLWNVDDVATAELMSRFYKAILQQGLSPAAALRQAQVEMWKQKRWRNPYYWGAFVLQGEWKSQDGQGVH